MVLKLKKNGRYYSARAYDGKRTPKEKLIPLRTPQKAAAMRLMAKYQRQIDEGKLDLWDMKAPTQVPTFDEAVAQFLQSRQGLRPKTLEAYTYALRGLGALLPPGARLDEIESGDITPYVTDLVVSAATQRHRFVHLRAFFRWGLSEDLIERTPMAKVRSPREQRKVAAFLSVGDLKRLIATIEADAEKKIKAGTAQGAEILWLRDVVMLAVCTGLRRGELCELRWRSVDLDTGHLAVLNHEAFQTKSHHERSIPIAGDARTVLERLSSQKKGFDDHVLKGAAGQPLCDDYVSKRFKKYVRLAGLDEKLHFHSLRHTCASWLVMRGVPLSVVKEILGHADFKTTQGYAHLAPQVMKQAMLDTFGATSLLSQAA